MSFCENCGSVLPENGSPCTVCAGHVQAGAVSAAIPMTANTGLQPNAAAALSYLAGFVTGILFLMIEPYKNDRFVRFHAFQSIFFNVAWVGLWVAWMILGIVLGAITRGLFIFIQLPIDLVLTLCGFCIWGYLLFAASQGRTFRLPFIGGLAAKQAGL